MRMWTMDIRILLLFCYACVSTSKGKVSFVSKNFFNVLHWDPMIETCSRENVHYTVRYRKHGGPLYPVKECENITTLSCDLTTFTIMTNHYYAQVQANGCSHSATLSTIRFDPLANTTLGSPNLRIRTTTTQLYINVTLPRGPRGVSIAHTIKHGFPDVVFDYNLRITEPKWAVHDIRNNTRGQFNITLKSNQKYCGYVFYRPLVRWNRKSENATFCVTLPDKPPKFLPWIVLGVVVLMVLLVLLVVSVCIYTKGGKPKTMPQSLVETIGNQGVLFFPDKNLVISKVLMISESEQTVYAKILVNPTSSSPRVEGYSPQETPRPSWLDMVGPSSPTPEPGNRSDGFSEIYSSVVVNVPDEEDEDEEEEEEEESQQVEGDMETNETPVAVSEGSLEDDSRTSTVGNNPDNQIILNTFRDTNGNLVLPSLSFEMQSVTGDAESSLPPERKPLLSDLLSSDGEPSFVSFKSSASSEWSDSGCDDSTFNTPTDAYCNTNYFPATVYSPSMHLEPQSRLPGDGSLESDYKPNWTPPVHQDTLNYPCVWNADRMEEEEEEEEDFTGILLGNWKLQVQE